MSWELFGKTLTAAWSYTRSTWEDADMHYSSVIIYKIYLRRRWHALQQRDQTRSLWEDADMHNSSVIIYKIYLRRLWHALQQRDHPISLREDFDMPYSSVIIQELFGKTLPCLTAWSDKKLFGKTPHSSVVKWTYENGLKFIKGPWKSLVAM